MAGSIFLIRDDGELVEMTEQKYGSEELLQKLLAKYANLLAGDQIDSANPRRWLLVAQEMGVPSEEQGSDTWALDHLFLDQDGIPTLVEVKRSSDTRIRREVVGQMLDYAANAVLYWPVEQVRAKFEANLQAEGRDPEQEVAAFVGDEAHSEEFWQKVKTNLQAGRVRLIFVADEIPPELRRVVEFLNKQMDPADVQAIEIKQFVGEGLTSLVPRVVGQTAPAKGPAREARQWDEKSFFQESQASVGTQETEVKRKILEWARSKMTRISWGKGRQFGVFTPLLGHKEGAHRLIAVWTSGGVQVLFGWMTRPPFNDEAKRLQLMQRLNEIEGVDIPADGVGKFPSIQMHVLVEDAALQQFLAALDWAVQEIKAF